MNKRVNHIRPNSRSWKTGFMQLTGLVLLVCLIGTAYSTEAATSPRVSAEVKQQASDKQARNLLRRLRKLQAAGKFGEVLRILKRIEKTNTAEPKELLLMEANAWARTGKPGQARLVLERYLRVAKTTDRFYPQAKKLENKLNKALRRKMTQSPGTKSDVSLDRQHPDSNSRPPSILIDSGSRTASSAHYQVKGTAADDTGVAVVDVNGTEAHLGTDGAFSASILLAPGDNEIRVTATDTEQNSTATSFTVTRTVAPLAETVDPDDVDEEEPVPIIEGSYFALLVGVENYQDESLNDLSRPINDAEAIANLLRQQYTFDAGNIIVLRDPTRAEIIGTLDRLSRQVTGHDNFLIFYAGHGFWDEQFQQGYWLPSDARRLTRDAWIANGTSRDYIRGIPSKHTLLVSDACFSGGIFRTRSAFADASIAIKKLYELDSRKAITSGTLTEVPDRSVFIKFLLKRLAENEDKYLSSEQLFTRFRTAVINNSPLEQVPQFGEIREAGDEGGDFIFVKR